MRPFQIIALSIFGVLALLGLLLFANFSGFAGGKAAVGAVTIWGTLPGDTMNRAIGNLKTAHSEFSKVTYVERQAASFDSDLADAIASGTGPDMVIITQEQLLTERAKLNVIPFKSIPERTYLDTYLPIGQLYLTTDGTYALPFVVDPLVLYYNRSILTSNGVAMPPSYWEAVTGLAPRITLQNATQQVTRSLIAFGDYGNIDNARAILSLLLLQAGTPITQNTAQGMQSFLTKSTTSGGDTFGTSPSESAMDFYTQFANPAKTIYSWNAALPSARQAFIAGDLALYLGFASEQPFLRVANPNLNFDMAPVPQPQTAITNVDYALAYAFAVPKASTNAVGALRTAEALAASDQLPTTALSLSMAPAARALLTPSASDPYAPIYYPAALIANGWLSPAPETTDSIFATMVENITSGRLSVRNALSTADQALSAALQ